MPHIIQNVEENTVVHSVEEPPSVGHFSHILIYNPIQYTHPKSHFYPFHSNVSSLLSFEFEAYDSESYNTDVGTIPSSTPALISVERPLIL